MCTSSGLVDKLRLDADFRRHPFHERGEAALGGHGSSHTGWSQDAPVFQGGRSMEPESEGPSRKTAGETCLVRKRQNSIQKV